LIYAHLASASPLRVVTHTGGENDTEDDWSTATFWYEPTPSAPLPPMPDVKARTIDIWPDLIPVEI
jgi:hypothetical protein